MVKIIGNVLAIRWTAGVVEHLRPSFSALLDAEDLGGAARVRDSALGGAASPAEAIQSHCARHGRRVRTDSAAPPPRRRISGPCGRVRGAYVGPLRPGLASLGTSCSTILGL